MSTRDPFRSWWSAFGLASVTVGIAAVLQSLLLFRPEVETLLEPPPVVVRQLEPERSGRFALATFVAPPPVAEHRFSYGLLRYDLEAATQRPCKIETGLAVWRFTCPADSSRVLITTLDGKLHALDAAAEAPVAERLGMNIGLQCGSMACTGDGSRLFVSDLHPPGITAWDVQRRRKLWCRSDLRFTKISVHPLSGNVIAGDVSGDIVELDGVTGAVQRRHQSYGVSIVGIAISDDGRFVSVVDWQGTCRVMNLETGQVVWSERTRGQLAPRFLPGSRAVVVANRTTNPNFAIVCLVTGEVLRRLPPPATPICKLVVNRQGTIYVCDARGAMTVYIAPSKKRSHESV